MSVDFLQVHQQIKKLGDQALVRANLLGNLRQSAMETFRNNAQNHDRLIQKVQTASNYRFRFALCNPPPDREYTI